ncbi:hypothetical protein [Bradyrhizobium sp. CCBAU 53415]|uniref:hypothetical protein n=1 Tax=Bradyrhizobium sp. CCBAU 53415 TaxID=1325119 RepID=UPI0023059580|nr:hypothetical protein [Bradyrhizobium sp. CCBAU 53415]MDA9464499.1 hypothetical protein [Bradyrhizobium sp. CCBAU 53415]
MIQHHANALVLSIYVNTRGFAFIVFEGYAPFDWGIREARGAGKRETCLSRITQLFDRHSPDVLVIQDTSTQGTERAPWISTLNASITALAKECGVPRFAYSRDQVRDAFARYECANKNSLAQLIAKQIPAFEQYVPPPRKPWMSEDRRMGLFDAAALALVFFRSLEQRGG